MTDRLQSRIDAALTPPTGLDERQLQLWMRMRSQVGRRHAAWRTGMPAIGELFDDEAHRAKALAGNLATELGDVLRGTVEIDPAALLSRDRPAAWGVDCCRDWLAALEDAGAQSLSGEHARAVYCAILVQLVEREHGRAVELARSRRLDGVARSSHVFSRAIGWIGAGVRRFFDPV